MNQDQLSICLEYGSAYVEAEDDEMVGVALATLDKEPLYGFRIVPAGDATGWYIYGGPWLDDPNFYQAISLGELKQRCPRVGKYLSLEPGFKFIINRAGYEDVWKDPIDAPAQT
jgi:hypothetical protein